jgi:hypothetical protein
MIHHFNLRNTIARPVIEERAYPIFVPLRRTVAAPADPPSALKYELSTAWGKVVDCVDFFDVFLQVNVGLSTVRARLGGLGSGTHVGMEGNGRGSVVRYDTHTQTTDFLDLQFLPWTSLFWGVLVSYLALFLSSSLPLPYDF